MPKPGPFELPLDGPKAEAFPRLSIVPKVAEYVRVPFEDGFDGREVVLNALEQGNLPIESKLYVVDFASLCKPGADLARLEYLDEHAHREAVESDGFLLYFRGDADSDGFNRSWCAWRSAEEAYNATHKPAHLEAMACVEDMYNWYAVNMRDMWLDRSKPKGYDSKLVRQISTGPAPYLAA